MEKNQKWDSTLGELCVLDLYTHCFREVLRMDPPPASHDQALVAMTMCGLQVNRYFENYTSGLNKAFAELKLE